jgi:hypothetical protein
LQQTSSADGFNEPSATTGDPPAATACPSTSYPAST